jgi:acetylornithine/succinyldiaminopimelate/putrescine aminotransferase
VQSGLGRTGYPFYAPVLGLRPDLMSVGKALGGGIPIGAALVSERVAKMVSPGDHGSTYGGNPLGTRAAAFVLDQLNNGLLDHVNTVGVHFERRLRSLALRHPSIVEVRGFGLMRALQLNTDAGTVVDAAREHGVLVNRTDERVVRLLPALNVEAVDIDRAVDVLDVVLSATGSETAP